MPKSSSVSRIGIMIDVALRDGNEENDLGSTAWWRMYEIQLLHLPIYPLPRCLILGRNLNEYPIQHMNTQDSGLS